MEQPFPLILSVPTSAAGATAAATYTFYTSNYKPPRQDRSSSSDRVQNQNGSFKYKYDSGPGPFIWSQFEVILADDFPDLPSATQMWTNLQHLWRYKDGPLGMEAPEGVYSIDWADAQPLERSFLTRKGAAGDKNRVEFRVPLNIEEG